MRNFIRGGLIILMGLTVLSAGGIVAYHEWVEPLVT